MNHPDTPVTHDDLWDAVENNRSRTEQWFIGCIAGALSLALASFIWIWSSHAAQAEINGAMDARVTAHIAAEERGIERVERQLEDLNAYLRENNHGPPRRPNP